MIPVRQGDGVGLSAAGFSEVREGDGTVLWSQGGAILDSVATRDDDDGTNTNSDRRGVKITTKSEWPSIGCKLSQNVAGVTEAQLIRWSDGVVLDKVDISGLSAGDTYTHDDVNLPANTDFALVAWDGGNDYTEGFDDDPSYPYESDDVDIINGVVFGTSTGNSISNIISVGNIGF